MPVNFHSNRQLHARNTKTVPIAQKRVDQVADLAQEQYVNALAVNGYDAMVYHRLDGGRRCTCSTVFNHNSAQVLDENGNASEEHIQSLLTGADFSIEDYGVKPNPQPTVAATKSLTPSDYIEDNMPFKKYRQDNLLSNPTTTEVVPVESLNDAFADVNLGAVSAQKCSLCYGSGFLGGYALHNGNRFILDVTYPQADLVGYTPAKEIYPNQFLQMDASGEVRFTVTLPIGIVGVDQIQVWCNEVMIKDATLQIGTSLTNLISLDATSILTYATGTPCIIVVSGVTRFTHLELQFNMSTIHTYIEYPRLTKTGDLSVLEAIDSVQLVVSPLVMNVQSWDIIVDNVFKKRWRVISSNWFNDRKMNIQGWDVQARLVQPYEVFTTIAGRFDNNTRYVNTRLPRK